MSELENPTTHSLVGDFEAALGQQILDVSEAQREAAIEPYGVLDDLGRESVATIGDLFHRWRLDCCHSTRKPINVTKPYGGRGTPKYYLVNTYRWNRHLNVRTVFMKKSKKVLQEKVLAELANGELVTTLCRRDDCLTSAPMEQLSLIA